MEWIETKTTPQKEILKMTESPMDLFTDEIKASVNEIEAMVKEEGDLALLKLTKRFDGVELENLRVPRSDFEDALASLSDEFFDALKRAKKNIEKYHQKQVRESFFTREENGAILGQMISPIQRVGLYVPGGTAAYPSSVLMNGIPALLAGVEEIALVSPPGKDGKVQPGVLAAAELLGIDEVYAIGGAQAIFAMSYGTPSIRKVDKIVGPGNVYVTYAKKQVYGQVDIDMIAGPSEVLIIADEGQNPRFIAGDLLSQAEHDTMASAILITPSKTLGEAVLAELDLQVKELLRRDMAEKSLKNRGKIIITKDLDEAFALSNEFAPEHLEILVSDPMTCLTKVKNAGCIFLGPYSPEPLGDYYAGTNHTLPTSGTAKYFSPLSVDDFIKKSSIVYYTKEGLKEAREDIGLLADNEGLEAHKKAVDLRFEDDE